jgi:septal ring factor EnvC (AmiA/AmiB activator)
MERSMSANTNPWDEFEQELQTELDQARRSLKEVSMMLEQSQSELTKLTQKNSMITGQLQQINAQFETVPRADIRNAFMLALDVQQRFAGDARSAGKTAKRPGKLAAVCCHAGKES